MCVLKGRGVFKQTKLRVLVLGVGLSLSISLDNGLSFASLSTLASDLVRTQSQKAVTGDELKQKISQHIEKTPEFKVLRQKAKELGVRVWLFGGTAASYAHYTKWDHLRETGDARYHPDRFDYQYLNIFRSTQDLDLVIDGDEAQANALEAFMAKEFPHVQGSKGEKSVWEVRLLRENLRDKDAVLSDDFQNQNTDSHSTGMIEVSTPPKGESVVRDSRDFNNQDNPAFLEDVRKGELTYYHSKKHSSTKRAKEGLNPEIISVIRDLTKLFQYELTQTPENIVVLKQIIQNFDPQALQEGTSTESKAYILRWLNNNGPKLLQHAMNLEYAVKVLDELGLRQKLLKIGDIDHEGSLAWWMNKKPLDSFELGAGPGSWTGRTAKDLNIAQVAHETKSYFAYESITKSHTLEPNVFTSRTSNRHEGATFGEGFYTKTGRTGAKNTGITIRFDVKPNAKEGIDFTFIPIENYVIFHNKKAFTVIPESLKFTWPQYIRFLSESQDFDPNDKAIVQKLRMGLKHSVHTVTDSEFKEIDTLATHELKKTNPIFHLIEEAIPLYEKKSPEKLKKLYLEYIKFKSTQLDDRNSNLVQFHEKFKNRFDHISHLITDSEFKEIDKITQGEFKKNYPDFSLIRVILPFYQKRNPEMLKKVWLSYANFSSKSSVNPAIQQFGFRDQFNEMRPAFLDLISDSEFTQIDKIVRNEFKKRKPDFSFISSFLPIYQKKGQLEKMKVLAEKFIKNKNPGTFTEKMKIIFKFKQPANYINTNDLFSVNYANLAQYFFSQPETVGMSDLIRLLIEKGNNNVLNYLSTHTFSKPHTKDMKDLLKLIIEKSDNMMLSLLINTFTLPHTYEMRDLLELIIKKGDSTVLKQLCKFVFSMPHTKDMKDLIELIIKKGDGYVLTDLVWYVFTEPHAKDMEDLLIKTIEKLPPKTLDNVVTVFTRPYSAHMTKALELLINKGGPETHFKLITNVFWFDHIQNRRDLLKLLIDKVGTHDNLLQSLEVAVFAKPHSQGPEYAVLREAVKIKDPLKRKAYLDLNYRSLSTPHISGGVANCILNNPNVSGN